MSSPPSKPHRYLSSNTRLPFRVRTGVQQGFQSPAVAATFDQIAVAMRVGIDQSRHQQPVGSVDGFCFSRRVKPGRADLQYCVFGNQYVSGRRGVCLDVQQSPAANHLQIGSCRHAAPGRCRLFDQHLP